MWIDVDGSSETTINFYRNARCHSTEDALKLHECDYLLCQSYDYSVTYGHSPIMYHLGIAYWSLDALNGAQEWKSVAQNSLYAISKNTEHKERIKMQIRKS